MEKADVNATPVSWHPEWVRELERAYRSGSACVFVLHGNVHDLMLVPGRPNCSLTEFMSSQLFGTWNVVLSHDAARGLRPQAAGDAKRRTEMIGLISKLSKAWGLDVPQWPHEVDKALPAIEAMIERNLLEPPDKRSSIGIILEHAQFLVASSDLDTLARGYASRLVRLLNWAQNPHIKQSNTAIFLISEKITELNERLTASPYVISIEVPLPSVEDRTLFIGSFFKDKDVSAYSDFTIEQLATMSNGLRLMDLNSILTQATEQRITAAGFKKLKKTLIERQCKGLIEFIEPKHTLEQVVGLMAAKQRLTEDAKLISEGRLDVAPMGYLICGPVGTGKTYLALGYAGSIGIPAISLRNFRSKYVGESEGDLECVLRVLRSLGPILVCIDEADASLGDGQEEGDSGVSKRIFAMIAAQMGDTRYRGKIIWMLMTKRPDRLPIDLKRQGRAEVHIPLFYPQTPQESMEMVNAMAIKNGVKLATDVREFPCESYYVGLSGADIESVVLNAHRQTLIDKKSEVTHADLMTAVKDFIPSAQGLEKDYQELVGVLEATQRNFLPEKWQKRIGERSALQKAAVEIRQLID